MIILLMMPFLFGNFVQKWYFPQGVSGFGNTTMQILDTNRDTHLEFVFTTYGSWPPYVYVYELHLPDTWQVDSIPLIGGDLLWDSGDFDNDGFYDLALQFHIESPSLSDGIMIFESPDSFSYPTQEVWRDTVGPPLVLPISAYDIDQDGYSEIVKMGGDLDTAHYTDFLIYESIDDNIYSVTYTIATETSPTSTVAFGDFDQDTFNEFVMGTIDGEYSVFESPDDNTYEARILNQQLSTVNIKDCFSVSDADGDGKMEFVVKGFWVYGTIDAFIFEAIGDNSYEIIKTFNFPGGDYYGGYSEAGDVNGDSIPEIVLEARQNVFIIKAEGNDSFYVWDTLPGHASGSCVRVYDIDENGLAEIIISGNDETRIYEYDPGGMEETTLRLLPDALRLEVYPNPARGDLKIIFNSPDERKVTIKLYDVTGRLVNEIFNGKAKIGTNEMPIMAENYAAGIYFIRIKTDKEIITEKFIMLK